MEVRGTVGHGGFICLRVVACESMGRRRAPASAQGPSRPGPCPIRRPAAGSIVRAAF